MVLESLNNKAEQDKLLDLVGRILEIKEDGITSEKKVENIAFYCPLHPGQKVMPGTLICEALAQVCARFLFIKFNEVKPMLVGFNKVWFKKAVFGGDVIRISARLVKQKGKACFFIGNVFVQNNLVSKAEIIFFK